MDEASKIKKVQAIINKFLDKLASIEKRKMAIIGGQKKTEEQEEIAKIEEKIKNL